MVDRKSIAGISPEMQAALDRAIAVFEAMTPEQQKAHRRAQQDSWVRGMMPTGDQRFD